MLDAFGAVLGTPGGGPGASVRNVAFHWTIVNGGGIVSSITGADSTTPSVTPSGPGSFSLTLTTTDSAGQTSTTSTTVTVAAAPEPAPPASSSGGGGGALGVGWLLLLLAAVLSLAAVEARERAEISAANARPGRTD